MENLRLAMDATFWDMEVASGLTLDGTVKSVPGEPAPLDGAQACGTPRPEQHAVLKLGFPLGILPTFSPPVHKENGLFSLQTCIPGPSNFHRWTGFIFRLRPKGLISKVKDEILAADDYDLIAAQDIGRRVLEKSHYDLGFFSEFDVTPDTSFMFNIERLGDINELRTKATIVHYLPKHKITVKAASPELFLDQKGTYWNTPLSLSFDVASTVISTGPVLLDEDSGLRYRFGLHNYTGNPQALSSSSGDAPLALLPGLCAKAAFSYEKSIDFWREREKVPPKKKWRSSYDDRLKEPHSALSGIIGGSCAAWFEGSAGLSGKTQITSASERKRTPSAHLFGSLCYTYQKGKFKDNFNDLTRLDARLDIPSAMSFLKGANHLITDAFRKPVKTEVDPLASPRLNLILQQQVAGPIVFQVDSRLSFNSRYLVDDVLLGLSYSLRFFDSGKVFAWYSPKRKESMIEFRLFEP